jgi:hypothetical protein
MNHLRKYKNDLRQNLKHAVKFFLAYHETFDIFSVVGIYKKNYAGRMPHVKELDYQNFIKVCEAAKKKNHLLMRKVTDSKGVILAIALFLKDKKRLYNIMSVVTAAGRQSEANHYLFDRLINEFSGQQIVLDFEGSNVPGIANFYKKFGAINEPYFFWRHNRLAWPLKYFK